MGRGQQGGSKQSPIFAKIVQKDANNNNCAVFELTKPNPDFDPNLPADKVNNPKVISDGTETSLSGKIIGVSTKRNVWDDDEKLSAKIILEDANEGEVYFIQFAQSGVARNIINSLAGVNKPGFVEISLWMNKAGYPTVGVQNDNERTKWSWHPSPQEDNEYTQKVSWAHNKKKGKDVPDYWELDVWLFETILGEQIAERVKAARAEDPKDDSPAEEQDQTAEPKETIPSDTETITVTDDDIPF